MDSLRDMLLGFQTVILTALFRIQQRSVEFNLNARPGVVSKGRVNWLKRIMAVMLLALWTPTTSHCLIESAGLLPDFLCCADACSPHGTDGDDDEDSCQSLESAPYKVDENDASVKAWIIAALVPELVEVFRLSENVPQPTVFIPDRPAELPVTWQFSRRTALAPRAPSFVS